MRQELGFSNAAYGFGAGIFFIGYFLFEIPSNIALEKTGAKIWFARIVLTWGIAPVALRYQNVFGPGQSLQNPYTGILSIFSNLIMKGQPINIFEDGTESRDFVYIDDVVVAPSGTVARTSSGKVQRALTKARYEAGEIAGRSAASGVPRKAGL